MGHFSDLQSCGTFTPVSEETMNKLLLSVLCVLALFVAAIPCLADNTANGVLAEERVVNLPNDQAKWYISVVGDTNDARYNEILGWFDSNTNLNKLKSQVHFNPVTTDTAIYKERYAPNVSGVPTVRLQKANGDVIYEASGVDIPMTASGLNGAMANAVNDEAQGIRLQKRRQAQPVMPWRDDTNNRLKGLEKPVNPGPTPDPTPQPIDNGGKPDVPIMEPEYELPSVFLVPACVLMVVIGLAIGYGKKLKEAWTPASK
jgi:hypothetical protein